MPPPAPSLQASSRELTAGTLELDTLLTIHLQVCKALLEVAEGQGRGHLPGAWAEGWESSLQKADLEGGGKRGAGAREPGAGSQGD